MLKIVCISDTHGKHWWLTNNNKLPEGDVIVHSGDCTARGDNEDIEEFLRWYGDLDYKDKILVAGNHDWGFEKEPSYCEELCENYGITYLRDSGVTINGIKFWGSPVQPEFNHWAFNKKRGKEISEYWDKIPKDTDVLITHGPPLDRNDLVTLSVSRNMGEKVGCYDLARVIEKIRPVVHIYGHIHEARGISVDPGNGKSPITYVNASTLDSYYSPWDEEAFVLDWNDLVDGKVEPYLPSLD